MSNLNSEMDSISRNRIVSETDRNFFVEAGAGSGKTTMLVNRMVAMVENGLDISKICAITFTKAAAGEFYKRFQQALILRSRKSDAPVEEPRPGQLPPTTELSRARCEEALKKIDLCFMGTIDSFCNVLLSEHPTEAGIPADAALISDEDMENTLRKEYIRMCRGEITPELQTAALTFHGANYKPEEIFCKGMQTLLEHRNAAFHYNTVTSLDIDRDFAEPRRQLLAMLEKLSEDPDRYKYDSEIKNLEAWNKLPDILQKLKPRWSRSLSTVILQLKNLQPLRLIANEDNRRSFEGELFQPRYSGKSIKWIETTLNAENGLRTRLRSLLYDLNMTFFHQCLPYLEQTLLEKGAMSYFDYLYYLRNMLRADAEKGGSLIPYIYSRHSYFLIDEFQDTNPMQSEVFFYLCAEHPVQQWQECIPRPGSLFIVGDPKQSIYRFRNADVTSFLRVKGLFQGEVGEVLELSRNFRSNRTLIADFNRVFSETLKEETDTQSKFTEIPMPENTDDGEFRGIYTCLGGKDTEGQTEYDVLSPEEEIAITIRKLVNNPHYQIRSGNHRDLRPLSYCDFMLITSSKAKLRGYREAFANYGIPCRVEGNVPFDENCALLEILSLYAAAADPAASDAIVGALTGKLFGFTMNELAEYVQSHGRLSIFTKQEVGAEDNSPVTAALSRLKELSSLCNKLSPSSLYRYLLEETKLYTRVAAEDLEIVYYVLELLRSKEKDGTIVTHADAVVYLRQLLDTDSEVERCLTLSEEIDCVHLANLHKVKGLEAPVVILAFCGPSSTRGSDIRMEYLSGGTEGYLFRLPKKEKNKGDYFSTDQYKDKDALEKAALKDEGKRQDYVAGTRAMNVLILGYGAGLNRGKVKVSSRWSCFAKDDDPRTIQTLLSNEPMCALPEPVMEDAADLYARGEADNVLNDRSAEDKSYEIRLPSQAKADSKLKEEAAADYSEEPLPAVENDKGSSAADTSARAEAHRHPTLLGTMTHRLMELLVTSHGRIDIAAAIPEIISEFSDCCDETNRAFAEVLQQAVQRMQSGGYPQQNGLPTDMLAELLSAEEVYCEVPFCYKDTADPEAPIWNGVMDVVYCKNGIWHIVDYKTNLDGSDLDRHYQGQLQAYIRAFRALTGHEADAMTYHISI